MVMVYEVDDVDSWLASPRRRELFGPLGISARTFVDHARPNHVGLVVETPSMELFQEATGSPCALAAMRNDGVRVETIQVLIEG
jgi:hypothetical protein